MCSADRIFRDWLFRHAVVRDSYSDSTIILIVSTVSGMLRQRNAGLKTIEGTLFDALARAGAVSEDNADDPVKVWQRQFMQED